jgi:hypothetical protein
MQRLGEEQLIIEESAECLRVAFGAPGFGSAFVLRMVVVVSLGTVPILVAGGSIAASWKAAVWLLAWSAVSLVTLARLWTLARMGSVLFISRQGVTLEERSPRRHEVQRSTLEDFAVLVVDSRGTDGRAFDLLPLRGSTFRFAGKIRHVFLGQRRSLLNEAERRIRNWLELQRGPRSA